MRLRTAVALGGLGALLAVVPGSLGATVYLRPLAQFPRDSSHILYTKKVEGKWRHSKVTGDHEPGWVIALALVLYFVDQFVGDWDGMDYTILSLAGYP